MTNDQKFPQAVKALGQFCCIRPFCLKDLPEGSELHLAIRDLAEMLHYDRCKLVGGEDCANFHDDFKMEKMHSACQDGKGFVACDCGNCMHCVWCYHACSFATKNRIMLFFSEKIGGRNNHFGDGSVGRPQNSARGGWGDAF